MALKPSVAWLCFLSVAAGRVAGITWPGSGIKVANIGSKTLRKQNAAAGMAVCSLYISPIMFCDYMH